MLDQIDGLAEIAHKAFKKGGWEWTDSAGIPSKLEIANEIHRQLLQVDKLREAPDFQGVETSCGCITVRCEREGDTDEVNVYLDLGYEFVAKDQRIAA